MRIFAHIPIVVHIFILACAVTVARVPPAWAQIVFATEGDYPPWNARNADGELEGFDIELVGAICAMLGKNCKMAEAGFPGMMDAVAEGEFDAIVSGIAITAERERKIDFSRPYMSLSVSFAASSSSRIAAEPPQTTEDLLLRLRTARIGTQTDTVNARLVENLLPQATLVTFPNQEELNVAVADSNVDAGLAATLAWKEPESVGAGALVPIGPRFSSAEYPVLGQGLGIGVAKSNHSLKTALDEAICRLTRDGTAARLSIKWFGDDLSVPCE